MHFYKQLLLTSIQNAASKRSSFLMEIVFILVNNFTFFILWLLFFRTFEEIRGWRLGEVSLVLGMTFFGWGVVSFFFAGLRNLSSKILHGELDGFLVQPKPVLMHVMMSESQPRGIGHMLTGIILVLISGGLTPFTFSLAVLGMLTSGVIFTAISVIAHSLVFFLGQLDRLPRIYCDTLLLFSGYPSNIYPSILQGIMYTVMPAGLIGSVPVGLIKNFSFDKLLILLFATLGFALFARWFFYRGLKRYVSGNNTAFRAS